MKWNVKNGQLHKIVQKVHLMSQICFAQVESQVEVKYLISEKLSFKVFFILYFCFSLFRNDTVYKVLLSSECRSVSETFHLTKNNTWKD